MRFTKQGVRNLDDPNWKYNIQSEEPISISSQQPEEKEEEIFDVIYRHLFQEDRIAIQENFTDVEFEDLYSEFRGNQTIVKLKSTRRNWYIYLLKKELENDSIQFQMSLKIHPRLILSILKGEDNG